VPKLETLEKISAALGVTLEEVIKGTEVESKYLK
jgi:transcriptional regulator with XRE-family HTH domain